MTISLIYGNISTAPMCARAALATSRLGKPYIRFHQIMMVMTSMAMIMMVMTRMAMVMMVMMIMEVVDRITVLATLDVIIQRSKLFWCVLQL